ncbi:MAG: hypothetical protein J0H08_14695 [Rhizobiales bacterium]|mgnify:CR=1 FL=1|nr:hypothetical protein [Hyphomicrobiales bacterium]
MPTASHQFSNVPHCRSAAEKTLEEFVCWSRMQAEAGQALDAIVRRKEMERRAGRGSFCWGVGNAPATMTNALARLGHPVLAIFSIMKSRPKAVDVQPARIFAWRRYVDSTGCVRPLPRHVLVTSRADSAGGPKDRHFALMCWSNEPLAIQRGVPFDPSAYRNAGGTGAPVGASQVTALLRRSSEGVGATGYEANMCAWLADSYWVRLTDPVECDADIDEIGALDVSSTSAWLAYVDRVRDGDRQRHAAAVQTDLLI